MTNANGTRNTRDWLEDSIWKQVYGDHGLIASAREYVHGDPGVPLESETVDAIASILWSQTDRRRIAHVARLAGYLTALFDWADKSGIAFCKHIEPLRQWCFVIFTELPGEAPETIEDAYLMRKTN
jgi:hypothetical protein